MKASLATFLITTIAIPEMVCAQFTDVTVTNSLKLETGVSGSSSLWLDSDGSLLSRIPTAWLGTSSTNPGSSESILLMWDPGKMAFRASYFDPAYMVINEGSTAFGWGDAYGAYSFAGNGGVAQGEVSTAFGIGYATGYISFAIGNNSYATGEGSFAGGVFTRADGFATFAHGFDSKATGECAVALGRGIIAGASGSVAVGGYNIGNYHISNDGNPSNDGDRAWIATDPIFEIGNGAPPSNANGWQAVRANAMTVLKNGDVIIPKRQGDILMGEFGN